MAIRVELKNGSFTLVPDGSSREVQLTAARTLKTEQASLARLQSQEDVLPGVVKPKATVKTNKPAEPVTQGNQVGTVNALLDLIRSKESNNNYSILVGGKEELPLDTMTIDEVMEYQKDIMLKKDSGFESSALGAYQIIYKTLGYLKKRMDLDGGETMTDELQDEMATELLRRRGLDGYLSGKYTKEQFGTFIAKEWASLPVIHEEAGKTRGESYWEGEGSNKAGVKPDVVLAAIESIKEPEISPEEATPKVPEEIEAGMIDDNFEVPTPDLAESLMAQEAASEEVPVTPTQSSMSEPNVPPTASQEPSAPPRTLQEAAIKKIPEDLVASAHPKTGNPTIVGQSNDPMPSLDEAIRERLG